MATLLRTTGETQAIEKKLTLREMHRLVGTDCVEFVNVGGTPERRELLIVDESGLLKDKPINHAATALYRGTPPRHDGVIVGDAIRAVCTHMGHDNEAYE